MIFRRLVSVASVLVLGIAFAGPARAATYRGAPTAIGNGTARAVVTTDAAGHPTAVMVVLTPGALQNLPPSDKAGGEWEYLIAMPRGAKTGFNHIAIDWNPHGHPPPHIYTVPHFDFHFYTVSRAQQLAVAFPKYPKDPASFVTDKAIVPPGYQVFPDTAVSEMGVHAAFMGAPEFHGVPFTRTFIYGYYKDRLTFLEPMITRAFLLSHPDVTIPLRTPASYSTAGWYPTKYVVRYDAARNVYILALTGLRHWE
jgi:hypothetical protein